MNCVSKNSYEAWNSNPKNFQYENISNDDILLNVAARDSSKNNDAFRLMASLDAKKHITDPKNIQDENIYKNRKYFEKFDVAEVIRGDYQRLAFDIDINNGDIEIEQFVLAIYQLKTIIEKFGIPLDNVHGIIELTRNGGIYRKPFLDYPDYDIITEFTNVFKNVITLENDEQSKDFSCHLTIPEYWFTRASLFDLFSQGKNHYNNTNEYCTVEFNINNPDEYCKHANYFSKYIDRSIFKNNGKQQIFRFGLSGKALKHRKCPDCTDEQYDEIIRKNFNNYLVSKTMYDLKENFISNNDNRYQAVRIYMDTLRKIDVTNKNRKTKKHQDLIDDIGNEIDSNSNIDKNIMEGLLGTDKIHGIYIPKKSDHREWIYSIILQMKMYILESDHEVSDDELFNEFIQKKYQYYSNSGHRYLKQDYSIRWAIQKVRDDSSHALNITTIIKLYEHALRNDLLNETTEFNLIVNNKINCFKYNIFEFKKLVSNGVSYVKLALYIYHTFIFFSNTKDEKNACGKIAYLDDHDELVIKDFKAFLNDRETDPIIIKLYRKYTFVDKRIKDESKAAKLEIILTPIPIKLAFDIFDRYKQRYYDYCNYSNDPNMFSLYCNPIKFNLDSEHHENNPKLPECVSKILDIISTEISDGNLIVNTAKKEYVLNWFAYILQHPEDRNRIALHIVSEQGVGKNILTNTICKYLGDEFSETNLNIDSVIGQYTGNLDNKLLLVINELDRSNKDMDRLKSIITEDCVSINKKYGNKYTAKNTASYIFLSNHTDTKIISNGDRRFTYIRSYGKPLDDSEYKNMCIPGTAGVLKDEYHNEFINYLLARDLSEFKPNTCEDFDKTALLDQARDENRSSVHSLLLCVLKAYGLMGIKMIGVNDFKNMINEAIITNKSLINDSDMDYGYTYFKNHIVSKINELQINLGTIEDHNLNGMDELMDEMCNYENDLHEEFNKIQLTSKTLTKIVDFNDDKDLVKYKCGIRNNAYTNKWVISLKSQLN